MRRSFLRFSCIGLFCAGLARAGPQGAHGRPPVLPEPWIRAVDSELWSEGYPAAHAIGLREVASYMRMLEAAGVITLEKRAVKNSGREVGHD